MHELNGEFNEAMSALQRNHQGELSFEFLTIFVVPVHELSHGADGNIGLDRDQSEEDVGCRVRQIVETSPDVERGIR